jgi:hypothetical protein
VVVFRSSFFDERRKHAGTQNTAFLRSGRNAGLACGSLRLPIVRMRRPCSAVLKIESLA